MLIEVLSREKAIQRSYIENEECIIISISNVVDKRPAFAINHSIRDILYLWFDDEEQGDTMISKEDARDIVNFVLKWKDRVNKIIVHCAAGVSRSAGVAAAIGKYVNDDDNFIFKNKRYVPNMACYRTVLNAFMEV